MTKNPITERSPNLDEIKRHFDPGDLTIAFYFGLMAMLGKYSIIDEGSQYQNLDNGGINSAIRKLILESSGSRLAIYRKELHRQKLEEIIKDNRMVPVHMEPFFSEARRS